MLHTVKMFYMFITFHYSFICIWHPNKCCQWKKRGGQGELADTVIIAMVFTFINIKLNDAID